MAIDQPQFIVTNEGFPVHIISVRTFFKTHRKTPFPGVASGLALRPAGGGNRVAACACLTLTERNSEKMTANLLAIIAPIMICATIGFAWERRGMPWDVDKITPLIVNAGTSCSVVSTLLKADISFFAVATVAGYAGLVHLSALVPGDSAVRLLRQDGWTFVPSLLLLTSGTIVLTDCSAAFC